MNFTLDLLKLTSQESDIDSLRNYLQVCDDSKLFQKKDCNIESVVAFINSLLNDSSDYEKAVMVLKVLLSQCKPFILERYLLQWLQQCFKGLQSSNNLVSPFSLLRDLILYSKDYPEVRKQTSLTIIPKILDFFFKTHWQITNELQIPFLQCLEQILLYYGKACSTWKNKIEQFVLSKLEFPIPIVNACANCYLKLAGIAPTVSDLNAYKEQWYSKQKRLISMLHILMDNLFNHINEIQGTYEKYIDRCDHSWIPEIAETDTTLIRIQRLTVQFSSTVEFLRILLLGKFPVAKKVLPDALFSVVCRGLSVTCTTLEASQSNDSVILSTQIPAIHFTCISLLEAMIQCCGRSLLAQSELICKIVSQTLKWTETNECEYGKTKPYSTLRVKAYDCFTYWLTTSRTGSSVEHYITEIIQSILSDIHYEKPAIKLNVFTKRLKGKVGKRERKKNKELLNMMDSDVCRTVDPLANRQVCKAALNLLPSLLNSASFLCSPNIHKRLQEAIVSELLTVQSADSISLELPIPYTDESCRLALYTSLLALCNNQHPKFPAPCNYAIPIFNIGLDDKSILVSRFCCQAVANIGKMLHPIGPTLSFPLELSNTISTSSNISAEVTTGTRSKFGESNFRNGENNDVNGILNDKDHLLDSFVLETVPILFDNHSSETTRVVESDQLDKVIRSLEDRQETENNDEPVKMDETDTNGIKVKRSSDKQPKEVKVTFGHQIVEKSKIQKRSTNDLIEISPEKKRKKESPERSKSADCELETEMLKSFIDIVI